MRVAWRRDDPEIEADAIDFWNWLGILPSGVAPEARAKELVAAAYADGKLAGVATATLEFIPELRARFAVLRCATDPDHRRQGAMWALAVPVHEILERWAAENPGEGVAGRLGANEVETWGELARLPMPPAPGVMLFRYNEQGDQIRGGWFDHFRFSDPTIAAEGALSDSPPESEAEVMALAADLDIRPAWRLDDAGIERDAIDFWRRMNILPQGVAPEARAKELAAVAYKDGRVVAVTTIQLARIEQVRARIGWLRAATDPEYRRGHASQALTIVTRDLLERWAAAHPEEKLAGMGAVIQSENLRERGLQPSWPTTKLTLIGWTDRNQQIRLVWFAGARLD